MAVKDDLKPRFEGGGWGLPVGDPQGNPPMATSLPIVKFRGRGTW